MLSISKSQDDSKKEYNTPIYLYEYLNRFFKFKIDPCATMGYNHLRVDYTYDKTTNGLDHEWEYATFVNPPYGEGNEDIWLLKCVNEFNKYGKPIFIILPAKTELQWFRNAMTSAQVIIFPRGRIPFIKDGVVKKSNMIGSVIFGFCSIQSPEYESFKKYNETLGEDIVWIQDNGFHSVYFPILKHIKTMYEIAQSTTVDMIAN